jgi:cytochrome c5
MNRSLQALLALGCIAACSPPPVDPAAAPEQGLLEGQRAYQNVCAGCHEEGKDGAPLTGDREAWADRSPLWAAVLEEHAKDGYLDMPAKGGDPDLSDEEVRAAVDHMMMLTHPEQPTE